MAKGSVLKEMVNFLTSGSNKSQASASEHLSKAERREIERLFQVYDEDGNGELTVPEIMNQLQHLAIDGKPLLSEQEVRKIVNAVDGDNTMTVGPKEFIELMAGAFGNSD